LHFATKASRLCRLGEPTYVERFEKTTKKDAQAQIQKAAQTPKVSSPQKLSRQ
jgi:hypothetical protein